MKLSAALQECINARDIDGIRAYLINAVGRQTLTLQLVKEVRRLMPDVFQSDDGHFSTVDKQSIDERMRNTIRADLSFNFSYEKLVLIAIDDTTNQGRLDEGSPRASVETRTTNDQIGDLDFFQALGAGFRAGKSEFQRRWRH